MRDFVRHVPRKRVLLVYGGKCVLRTVIPMSVDCTLQRRFFMPSLSANLSARVGEGFTYHTLSAGPSKWIVSKLVPAANGLTYPTSKSTLRAPRATTRLEPQDPFYVSGTPQSDRATGRAFASASAPGRGATALQARRTVCLNRRVGSAPTRALGLWLGCGIMMGEGVWQWRAGESISGRDAGDRRYRWRRRRPDIVNGL
ncbi:hypothetical protein C8Q78DRAFT_585448 [Trametes maxima]|nr:hypothetical protein C8Q78DRAFT_585448 [Trametes maxima]